MKSAFLWDDFQWYQRFCPSAPTVDYWSSCLKAVCTLGENSYQLLCVTYTG